MVLNSGYLGCNRGWLGGLGNLWGSGPKGLGLRVYGVGPRASGLRFRGWGLGLTV